MHGRILFTFLIATVAVLFSCQVALATDFVDVADDPPKYVGKTFTFLVWLEPGTISRHKLEDRDGKTTHADGYVVELADGTKEYGKGDGIGNRFGFQSGMNKLNPFLDKRARPEAKGSAR